jgi:hypothetical protein
MLRIVTACAALGLTACAASTAAATGLPQAQGQRLSDSTFIASYPSGWTKQVTQVHGATRYALASKGSLSPLGIPETDAIGISVTTIPIAALQSEGVKNASTLTLSQLASDLVGIPKGVTDVVALQHARAIAVGSDSGLEAELSYADAGQSNIQEDILVKHETVVYLIELDVAPTLRTKGEADLAAMASSWGWLA